MSILHLVRKLNEDAMLRAQLKLGRDEGPTIKKRQKPPRPAASYRSARRNAARAEGRLAMWRATPNAKYVPYINQSKIYRRPVRSEWQRRMDAMTRAIRKLVAA